MDIHRKKKGENTYRTMRFSIRGNASTGTDVIRLLPRFLKNKRERNKQSLLHLLNDSFILFFYDRD